MLVKEDLRSTKKWTTWQMFKSWNPIGYMSRETVKGKRLQEIL